ncbi:MAG: cytochrome c/FTR1 family iron permease [Gemmatimonadetes bacterium]|nr:cytochrome c/FTR1 family iron permease [Gemmatimonadota bacterium]
MRAPLAAAQAAQNSVLTTAVAAAQDHPGKRLAGIVAVALDEYAKGVDVRGRLISATELDEAVSFLGDAREVAGRLTGSNTALVRALVDTIAANARAKVPPAQLAAIHQRFVAALGPDAALDLPTRRVDLARGQKLYSGNCASCHGALADGNGPAAKALVTPPPALADAKMREVSPAAMYRIVSVGIAGTAMAGWAGSLTTDDRWDIVHYLASLRSTSTQVARGDSIWRAAHPATLPGKPAPAATLPAELANFAYAAERSDAQLALTIRDAGAATGTTAPLADEQVTDVIAFLRALPAQDASMIAAAPPAAPANDAKAAARAVLSLLDEALAAAKAGKPADAGDKAFDAYLAFEPLETRARAQEPAKVSALEASFAAFKAAVKGGNVASAAAARDSIALALPHMVELAQPAGGFWELFLQSFLIILREGFEAILVIGAIITFLVKTGHRERVRSVWAGVVVALAASFATAFVLATALAHLPASREIVEGVTLLIAVAVLFSVSYWLISKVEAAKWQQFIRDKVNTALAQGGGAALAFTAFLAVYREGAETALFFQALFQQPGDVAAPLSLGIAIGFVALAGIFVAFHRFGVKIPMRPFFAATSGMLYLMAFVFMGKGIRELQEGNALGITLLPGWPTIDALGVFPSREGMIAQGVMLALLGIALYLTWASARKTAREAAEAQAADAVPQHVHVDLEGRVAELTAKARRLEERLAMLELELQAERRKAERQ